MNLTKLFISCIASLLIACTSSKINMKVDYMFDTIHPENWSDPRDSTIDATFMYDRGDTAYYTLHSNSKGVRTIKFIKQKDDRFNNEAAKIKGFRLIGVFTEPKGLPGLTMLIYVNKNKGLFIKYFFKSGKFFFCTLCTPNNYNPLKKISFQRIEKDTIIIHDTFRLEGNKFIRQGDH